MSDSENVVDMEERRTSLRTLIEQNELSLQKTLELMSKLGTRLMSFYEKLEKMEADLANHLSSGSCIRLPDDPLLRRSSDVHPS